MATVAPLTDTNRHDMTLLDDGNYLVMAHEQADRDLSELTFGNFSTSQRVRDSAIQIRTPGGTPLLTWSSHDAIPFEDCKPNFPPQNTDYAHLNTLQMVDGHIVASFRGCNTVLRIDPDDASSHKVVWRVALTNLSDEQWGRPRQGAGAAGHHRRRRGTVLRPARNLAAAQRPPHLVRQRRPVHARSVARHPTACETGRRVQPRGGIRPRCRQQRGRVLAGPLPGRRTLKGGGRPRSRRKVGGRRLAHRLGRVRAAAQTHGVRHPGRPEHRRGEVLDRAPASRRLVGINTAHTVEPGGARGRAGAAAGSHRRGRPHVDRPPRCGRPSDGGGGVQPARRGLRRGEVVGERQRRVR